MEIPDRVLAHLCDAVSQPDLSRTRYEVIDLIGRGGMGAVYRARDTLLHREIALKVIDIPAAGGPDSALDEARLLAALEHPGIVAVHDAGLLPDGRAFCAMRRVDGLRLDAFIDKEPALSERLSVFEKLCEAVAFAHSKGVIHRDLKPENVMVGPFGEVIALDWGVALWAARGDSGLEKVAGTYRYMAPEQARGEAIDETADIFSLGVLLEEMLRVPAPRPLAAVAAKARAEEPHRRYRKVRDMTADVRRYQDRLPVSAYAERPWERALRFADRNRILLILVATYVIVRVLLFFAGSR